MATKNPPGLGIDHFGNPAIDPTKNVIDFTNAAVKRIDDIAALRDQLLDEKILRMQVHLDAQENIYVLLAQHNDELESDRVDKIRSVDVANAAQTATQLLSAVTTLATTAQATAETLRNQVASTATAVANQAERVVNPILERLALLEKASYTGAGKAGVSDPMMEQLFTRMQALTEARSAATGKSEGISVSWAILITIIMAGLAAAAFFRSLPLVTTAPVSVSAPAPAPASAPQVIYQVPAPIQQQVK